MKLGCTYYGFYSFTIPYAFSLLFRNVVSLSSKTTEAIFKSLLRIVTYQYYAFFINLIFSRFFFLNSLFYTEPILDLKRFLLHFVCGIASTVLLPLTGATR